MRLRNFLLLLLAAIALGVVLLALATADFTDIGRGLLPSLGPECVGVLRLEGEIDNARSGKFFEKGGVSARVAEAIVRAEEDESVGSVLLVVNSPGGSAVASKEIYDAVSESKKPVVAYLSELAASGGYYVASASDYIIANPNTITGSIGARATVLNYEELLSKLGLRVDALKTGELKDIGEGYRNLTEKERRVLEAIINEAFENFRDDVVKAREGKLNKKLFNEALDARVLTAKQALAIGLVDEINSSTNALRKAAQFGNVSLSEGDLPHVCELEEESPFSALLSEFSSSIARGLAEGFSQPRLSLRYAYG